MAISEHPSDCAYCRAGEGSIHNYEPSLTEHTVGTVVQDAYDRTYTVTEIYTVNGKARYVVTMVRNEVTETLTLEWNDIRMMSIIV